ncbi:MAG: peptidase S10 [Acidobacteriia bacterium]|nr:peptidase S10 [Terriglobia bacterium]
MKRRSVVLLTLAAALALPSYSQRPNRQPEAPPAAGAAQGAAPAPAGPPPKVEEKTSTTSHSIQIAGQTVNYTATAGTLVLKKEDGTPTASMFYVAYTRDGVGDVARRPITFAFNGGPGSSAVWLQMGALGPKRVALAPDGTPLPPPYRMVDNEYSILDITDLVFIDPVSTGYSRAVPESTATNFHGYTGDLQSVGEFIRQYATRNSRWLSPKFLAGESYGTTRAAALSSYLQQTLGMNLNGVVLISSVLNFQTISFGIGNDLPYALFLPTYTATAWFHHKLPQDLQSAGLAKAVDESRRYAGGPYQTALFKGDGLSAEERAAVVKNLARLTGLSAKFIEGWNLRIPMGSFSKELLRDQRRTVGRYDSRLEGTDLEAASDQPDYDPSYASVQGPYTAVFNQYVHDELKFQTDLAYEVLTARVQPWSFREFENRYVNVAERLRSAMTQNAALRVYVACGYYDLATPFFGAEYTVSHMLLDAGLRSHIQLGYFEAGHMLYTNLKSLGALKAELAKFYGVP